MKTLRRFNHEEEAVIARQRLADAGIEAVIADAVAAASYPSAVWGAGGIRLMVDDADEAGARRVLDSTGLGLSDDFEPPVGEGEFNAPPPGRHATSLEHTPLANFALQIGEIAALAGCVAAVIGGLWMLVRGLLLPALFVAPLAFFQSLAMWVVFVRIRKV